MAKQWDGLTLNMSFPHHFKAIHQNGGDQSTIMQAYSDEVVERGGKETRLSLESSRSITLKAFKNGPWIKHGLNKLSE